MLRGGALGLKADFRGLCAEARKTRDLMRDAKTCIDAFKTLTRNGFLLPSERGSIPCAVLLR